MDKEKQHNEDFCIGSTNRGVTDTGKIGPGVDSPRLTAILDWVEFTIWNKSVQEVAEEILGLIDLAADLKAKKKAGENLFEKRFFPHPFPKKLLQCLQMELQSLSSMISSQKIIKKILIMSQTIFLW